MKIVATSDWHLDWVTHGVRRFEELHKAARATVNTALTQAADLYVFTGDLCNPDSGSCVFQVLELAQEVAIDLASHGIPSIWISGNHDVIEDGTGKTSLSPMRALQGEHIHVFETGTTKPIKFSGGLWLDVLALPYPSVTKPYDIEQTIELFSNVTKNVPAPSGTPVLVLSHLTVPGVQPGEEVGEMARGRDVVYPVDKVIKAITQENKRGLLINGHYHRQQSLNYGGVYLHIPGSLARLTFGEEFHHPGYLVIDL